MKIFYKALNTLAVLALIPILLFLPMFRFIMVVGVNSSSEILSLLGSMLDISSIISNATGIDIDNLPEYYTISDAIGVFVGDDAAISSADIDVSALPSSMIHYFEAAGILFVLALIFAVVVLFVGMFTKKKSVCAVFSVFAALSAFAGGKCFEYISEQLVSGKISMVEILGSMESLQEYSAYLDYVDVDIRIFELGSAYTMTLVVLVALVILNVGFKLVETYNAGKS